MKYLKLFENFSQFSQELIDNLINDIRDSAEKNGVNVILEDTETIPYIIGGFPCSGYFVDYGKPTLGVAMKKPVEEFIMVLCHESCHMDQWIEKSDAWNNNFINGKEAVEWIDEWCGGLELSDSELERAVIAARGVELDCERRTINKAIKYKLPINIKEEIQKANSYILFYTMIKDTRKWNVPGKAPYQIKEVWSQMPATFDIDYTIVPDDIKELYNKYLF